MPDTIDLELDLFLDALDDYRKARRSRDKARDDCDHSWGYFGHEHEQRVDEARTKTVSALKDVVRSIVTEERSNESSQ
jgi:hypothetical protein